MRQNEMYDVQIQNELWFKVGENLQLANTDKKLLLHDLRAPLRLRA